MFCASCIWLYVCLSLIRGRYSLWSFWRFGLGHSLGILLPLFAYNLKNFWMVSQIYYAFLSHVWNFFQNSCSFGLEPLHHLSVLILYLLLYSLYFKALLVFSSWVIGDFSIPSLFQFEFSSVFLSPYWVPVSSLELSLLFSSALCLCLLCRPSLRCLLF